MKQQNFEDKSVIAQEQGAMVLGSLAKVCPRGVRLVRFP